MSASARVLVTVLLVSVGLASPALAQDSAGQEDAAPVPLPPPTLDDAAPAEPAPEPSSAEPDEPESAPAEPSEGETRAPLPILERVGGRPPPAPPEHLRGRDEGHPNATPLPEDVAFVTPGDLRNRQNIGAFPAPPPPATPPPPYALSIAAGFTRELAPMAPIDYARIEERFEVRLPELGGFLFGAAVEQLFDTQNYIIEVGPRVGMSAYFCDEGEVKCEGAVHVQPGIAFGLVGLQFDLQGSLDVRLLISRIFQVGVTGSYSSINGGNFISLTGMLGLAF